MIFMTDELKHYGTKRHSGRYPWGSGKDPYQRSMTFNAYVSLMKKEGMTETEIAKMNGMTTTELRNKITVSRAENRAADEAMAQQLRDRGYSPTEIGRRMGKNESSIRNLLDPSMKAKTKVIKNISDVMKERIDSGNYIDIGVGSENHLGVARTKMLAAVSELVKQGYTKHYIQIEQPFSPGDKTTILTLAPPDTTTREVYQNIDKLSTIGKYSEDKGKTFLGIEDPVSVDSKRISVRYKEDGGSKQDGVIELRRGVPDLDLGDSRHSQVRIMVDNSHYLKGMAIYSDDLPDGVDIRFNTNKGREAGKMGVMKELTSDKDNPFKSTIHQKHYIDANGKEHLSALNIVGSKEGAGEEGSWDKWSRTLSSQMLSKQSPTLAKSQLNLDYDNRVTEYNDILKLTNPAVKKKLLETFSDNADAAAVDLKAAALPRQRSQVLIPIPNIKENQIYAPNFNHGEKVVLIRHPHGGTFEIPELTVNLNHPTAKKRLGNSQDGVGINPKTAEKLSGADFDGDTVLVIPNNNKNKNMNVKVSSSLKALENFDPKIAYPAYDGMKTIDGGTWNSKTGKVEYTKAPSNYMQNQMGQISNLITDMTIRGANQSELARAVKHSMVIIDSEKHALNYKQSAKDNNIVELKKKYQDGSGASTLISKASSEQRVPARKEGAIDPKTGKRIYIDPNTGEKLFTPTGESYTRKKDGKEVVKTTKSTKMGEEKDPYKLSSGSRMENIYAEHATKLKKLANDARKETLSMQNTPLSPSARKVYATEVASLDAKLNLALRNKPLERQAQIQANMVIEAKKQANPGMNKDELKKVKIQALNGARNRVGAKKQAIDITPREWEAIQAGAVSNSKLTQILNNVKDLNQVKEYATPRSKNQGMTSAKIARAKALLAQGYPQSEVASMLGVSVTTVMNAVR